MKNIIYYIRRKRQALVSDVNDAAISGLRKIGVEFDIKYEDEYEPSNIAILFGFYKNVNSTGRLRKIIYDSQKNLGMKIMVLERGFLKREEYHSIGWGGICGRANFNNLNSPIDRLEKLNLEIKPWKIKSKSIIICGQVPWDSNLQHINAEYKKGPDAVKGYLNWLGKLSNDLINGPIGKREIVFRPHPLFSRPEYYKEVIPETIRWSDTSLDVDLNRAYACFAFNSNSIVEAIISGVHGFAFDSGSVAYNYTNTNIEQLKNPVKFNREQWLCDLAYSQWNIDEISRGLFWEHLNGQKENA